MKFIQKWITAHTESSLFKAIQIGNLEGVKTCLDKGASLEAEYVSSSEGLAAMVVGPSRGGHLNL